MVLSSIEEMDRAESLKRQLLQAIRGKIKQEGWSQSQAGRLSGLPRTHMNNILRGTADAIGFNRLLRIAEGIGLRVELKIHDEGKGKAE